MKIKFLVVTILAIALFSTSVYASPEDNPGQVIDNPWANLDGFYNVENYKSNTPYTYPSKSGKIFAGWYTDSTCETPYMENTGRAYAKFVDEKVLTVKFQLKNDGTAIRFLSTVDSLDYSAIGFIYSGTYGESTISVRAKECAKVYKTLVAANTTVYPTVFSEDSQYFYAYAVRGLQAGVDMTWDVVPFWTTPDGTTVKGPSKHYPVN